MDGGLITALLLVAAVLGLLSRGMGRPDGPGVV